MVDIGGRKFGVGETRKIHVHQYYLGPGAHRDQTLLIDLRITMDLGMRKVPHSFLVVPGYTIPSAGLRPFIENESPNSLL